MRRPHLLVDLVTSSLYRTDLPEVFLANHLGFSDQGLGQAGCPVRMRQGLSMLADLGHDGTELHLQFAQVTHFVQAVSTHVRVRSKAASLLGCG